MPSTTLSLPVSRVFMVLGLLAATLQLPGNAAPAPTTGQRIIPLSAVRLPEGVTRHGAWPKSRFNAGFQEKTASDDAGITLNTSVYAVVGAVSVGSPGRWQTATGSPAPVGFALKWGDFSQVSADMDQPVRHGLLLPRR